MANVLLTPQIITRKALAILHQKLNFVSKVNRQYDDRFAVSGAKIGTTLNIRKPPRYTVSTGAALSIQDSVDTQVPLTVNRRLDRERRACRSVQDGLSASGFGDRTGSQSDAFPVGQEVHDQQPDACRQEEHDPEHGHHRHDGGRAEGPVPALGQDRRAVRSRHAGPHLGL